MARRALLLTVGSQGDVQPFVALARRLRAEGHEAVLAAPAMFGGLAAAYDVPFVPLDLDMSQVASLSFGAGPHYCLGAFLAGPQGEVLFLRLLRRFPDCGRPASRSTGRRARLCAAWSSCRCT